MKRLNSIANFLRQFNINVLSVSESTDWQVEDDEIQLEKNYYLQIGDNYIVLNHMSEDETTFTEIGTFKLINHQLANFIKLQLSK
jgi:hypothetical protein